jgi:hypothetical protein
MSRPRKRPPLGPQELARQLFGPLDGAKVPGGCPRCDAYQTVDPLAAGDWLLTIVHDDDCPELARVAGGAA